MSSFGLVRLAGICLERSHMFVIITDTGYGQMICLVMAKAMEILIPGTPDPNDHGDVQAFSSGGIFRFGITAR